MNSCLLIAIPGNATVPDALTPDQTLRMNVGDFIQVQSEGNTSLNNIYSCNLNLSLGF